MFPPTFQLGQNQSYVTFCNLNNLLVWLYVAGKNWHQNFRFTVILQFFMRAQSFNFSLIGCNRPVGRAVTRSSLEQEVRGSNLGPVKLDTVLPRLATAATFLQKTLCCLGVMTRRCAPPTRYIFLHNTASIIKDLVCLNRLHLLLKFHFM